MIRVRRRLSAIVRATVVMFFFLLFGAGSVVISPLMLLLRSPRRCQPVVRALWIPFVAFLRLAGIIGVDRGNLPSALKGCVIAANHPSLIDVVIVLALVPRTLFVAKAALLRNPLMAAVVRNTSLPVDERLPEAAMPYLRDGCSRRVRALRRPAGFIRSIAAWRTSCCGWDLRSSVWASGFRGGSSAKGRARGMWDPSVSSILCVPILPRGICPATPRGRCGRRRCA